MQKPILYIKNTSKNPLPTFKTKGSAGMDICAVLEAEITINPMQRVLIKTGLFLEIPIGYEVQVRPRSGLALKKGLTVLNTPGTIDSDYRGEIGVILINLSNESVIIENGERIAQLVMAKHETPQIISIEKLSDTERGDGGFGSTGKK